MNELIEKAGGLTSAVLIIAVCLNAMLSATSIILGKVKDLTESQADNKAYEIVSKILGGLQQVIDFLGANVKH